MSVLQVERSSPTSSTINLDICSEAQGGNSTPPHTILDPPSMPRAAGYFPDSTFKPYISCPRGSLLKELRWSPGPALPCVKGTHGSCSTGTLVGQRENTERQLSGLS